MFTEDRPDKSRLMPSFASTSSLFDPRKLSLDSFAELQTTGTLSPVCSPSGISSIRGMSTFKT